MLNRKCLFRQPTLHVHLLLDFDLLVLALIDERYLDLLLLHEASLLNVELLLGLCECISRVVIRVCNVVRWLKQTIPQLV